MNALKDFLGGDRVVVVTASMLQWVKPWCESHGVAEVLATEPEIDSCTSTLTGRFATPNCHGEEKMRRVRALVGEPGGYEIWAYGDSHGDDAMLEAARFPRRVQKP